MTPRIVLPVLGLVVLIAVAGVAGGLVAILQTKSQAQKNQAHFDCAVSVFAQTEPPRCAEIIAEFRRNGIFPPAAP